MAKKPPKNKGINMPAGYIRGLIVRAKIILPRLKEPLPERWSTGDDNKLRDDIVSLLSFITTLEVVYEKELE